MTMLKEGFSKLYPGDDHVNSELKLKILKKDIRSEYMATHNSSGSNLEHGLDDSREVDMDGSDTSGGGSDGKGNITFPIIKVLILNLYRQYCMNHTSCLVQYFMLILYGS